MEIIGPRLAFRADWREPFAASLIDWSVGRKGIPLISHPTYFLIGIRTELATNSAEQLPKGLLWQFKELLSPVLRVVFRSEQSVLLRLALDHLCIYHFHVGSDGTKTQGFNFHFARGVLGKTR